VKLARSHFCGGDIADANMSNLSNHCHLDIPQFTISNVARETQKDFFVFRVIEIQPALATKAILISWLVMLAGGRQRFVVFTLETNL
jgi:hypothetical protein